MCKLSLVLGLVAGLVLAAPAAAQEQETSDVTKARLEALSGRTYLGTILSDDGKAVEIKTVEGATLKLPYEQLTPKTQYMLRIVRTPDDVDSQLALADWCVDETLYTEAKRAFRAALVKDPLRADEVTELFDKARTKAGKQKPVSCQETLLELLSQTSTEAKRAHRTLKRSRLRSMQPEQHEEEPADARPALPSKETKKD